MFKMKSKFFITIFASLALIFLASAGWFYALSKMSFTRKEILELRKNILRAEKKNIAEKSLTGLLNDVKRKKRPLGPFF